MSNLIPFQNNSPMAQQNLNPAIAAAAETAKAEIQAAYVVAHQVPRNAELCNRNIIQNCKRKRFAEKAIYKRPVGNGKSVEGLSIRFAETAIREWRNIRTSQTTIYEDENVRRIKVNCLDLETNTGYTKELDIAKIVERKSDKGREVVGERLNSYGEKIYIVKATDEEIYNKVETAVSKAIRNSGLRLIPEDILDEAFEVCKETIIEGVRQNLQEETKKAIKAFESLNISVDMLQQLLGHDVSKSSEDEVVELRKIYQAIKQKEATFNDFLELREYEGLSEDEKITLDKIRVKTKRMTNRLTTM